MEKSLRPIVDHIKEKAPAYALAVVVGIGSLAIMADNGEDAGKVTNIQQETPTFTEEPAPEYTSHDDFCEQQGAEEREAQKGC